MYSLSYSFLMPPTVLIVVCLVAAVLALWRPRAGAALMLCGAILLYVSSLPDMAGVLLRQLESAIPATPDARGAQAIVVLGGDIEFGRGTVPDQVGPLTLQRLVIAAQLYRTVGLPIAVSGGHVRGSSSTLAALMRAELEQDFGISVAWTEDRSTTTFEDASFCAAMLQPAHITSVFVVTQAEHMPRALWSFERVGFRAIPWSTPRRAPFSPEIDGFLPDAGAFAQTFRALHEILGLAYYRLRH
jgi:uncharacterized SAM-binding protein YcdF (DUF218 family)